MPLRGKMMYYRVLLTLFFLPAVCSGQDLQRDVQRLMATKYAPVAEKAEKLAKERRFGDGHQLWLTAVPDDEKTAADYFLLGNVLFEAIPEKALAFHQRAANLEPGVADIQLELAMCLHKTGRFEEAATAYEAYIQSPTAKSRGPGIFDALLADCRIRTGEYAKACDAWERVPFRSYRIKISKYVQKIHGNGSPFQRHFDLLARAREKDINAAADLILLDCAWDWDWWSVEVNRDFLKADVNELDTLFPATDNRLLLMQAIAVYHDAESPNIAQFEQALKSSKLLIGVAPELPPHGLLCSHATRLVLENKLATPAELLGMHRNRFEVELQKMAEDIDVELINVYASLLAQSKKSDELVRVDRIMWQKTKEPRFAASYLVSLVQAGKDRTDKDVAQLIDDFSDDRVVSSIALSLAEAEKLPLTKPLAVAIAAEFHSLTPDPMSGTRTSDRLNALFKALRQSLSQ